MAFWKGFAGFFFAAAVALVAYTCVHAIYMQGWFTGYNCGAIHGVNC